MKARKLPSGKWICEGSFTIEGEHHRKSFTADTKKAAEDLAFEFRSAGLSPTKGNVGNAVLKYIEARTPVLSPSTIRSYHTMYRHIMENYPEVARVLVNDFDTNMAQKLVNDLAKSHSPKTVRNYYALLVSSMPFRRSVWLCVALPAPVRPSYRVPTSNAVQAILEASRGTELEVPILLASVCTMRAGEISALTMDDIEGNRIHISKSMVRGRKDWSIKQPKTYSSDRYVEAPKWLIEKVKEVGLPDLTPSAISVKFGRFLKKNGLPSCRFHDLRHYSASYMHAMGVPTAYIMKRGGWNTETVLNAVYRHALDDIDREQNDKINAEFSELFS